MVYQPINLNVQYLCYIKSLIKLILNEDCKPKMWLAHLSSNLVAALAGLDVDDLPHGCCKSGLLPPNGSSAVVGATSSTAAATTPVLLLFGLPLLLLLLLLLFLGLLLLLPVLLLGPQPLLPAYT